MSRGQAIPVLICACTLFVGQPSWSIDITTTGSWSEYIDVDDLQSGAGSDLTDTYTSAVDEVTLDIDNTTGSSDSWRVDVSRADTDWPTGVRLYVQRTSAGTGSGSISGGGTYSEVTSSDTTFFSGAGDRTGIDIQLRITGMSLSVSPDTYLTTVTYSVVDT